MIFFRLTLLTALLSICLTVTDAQTISSASTPQKTLSKNAIAAKLDELLNRYTQYGFSGTVLVARDGKIILNRGYGLANKESKSANTADTFFAIGSLTKQFTAAAILQLEEQGKLNTQDLASKYLGEFPPDKAGITLHHLLTHTSGLLGDGGETQRYLDTRDKYVEAVKKLKLLFAPGEKYNYSNVGYILLAAIVEKISGRSFEDYLQQKLFKPAGLKNTGFVGKGKWKESNLSVGYEPAAIGSGSFSPAVPKPSNWNDFGAGGVLSTTGDLYKWYLALKKDKILSKASRKKLYTPFLEGYAYGWGIGKTKQDKLIIQHSGDVSGFQSWLAQFPEEDLLIIAIINNRMRWRTLLTGTLQNVAFGEKYEMPPALLPANSLKLENYAGVYRLPTGGTLHASANADGFYVGAEGQDAINLLNRVNEKDVALYRQLNERTQKLIEQFTREDFSGLKEFSDSPNPAEQISATAKRWKSMVADHGAVKTVQNLGTLRSRTGPAVTFTRVEYEKGTEVLRVLWSGDKITGFGTSVPRPSIAQYMPETQNKFTSFDILTSQITGIGFGVKENGTVENLILTSKEGTVTAKKIE